MESHHERRPATLPAPLAPEDTTPTPTQAEADANLAAVLGTPQEPDQQKKSMNPQEGAHGYTTR